MERLLPPNGISCKEMDEMIKEYFGDKLSPNKIWVLKQNKPTLIVEDFNHFGVPSKLTYSILLARGVFKWLSCRRDLIKLKLEWKAELSILYKKAQRKKGTPEHREIVGRIKTLEKCSKQIRSICHSERFIAPDFDESARKFLERLQNENN